MISLQDIARKLALDSPEDAEFIVCKAIRDGVIDATIDHDNRYVQSKENIDVYSTTEPQNAFHQRISFSLDIYNQSVKAMRYPPKSKNKEKGRNRIWNTRKKSPRMMTMTSRSGENCEYWTIEDSIDTSHTEIIHRYFSHRNCLRTR